MVREKRGMDNGVMLGETSGKRRRGRPITRWLDNWNNIKGPSIQAWYGTPDIEPIGEVLPRLSPGVGHDSTAQCDKVQKAASRVTWQIWQGTTYSNTVSFVQERLYCLIIWHYTYHIGHRDMAVVQFDIIMGLVLSIVLIRKWWWLIASIT